MSLKFRYFLAVDGIADADPDDAACGAILRRGQSKSVILPAPLITGHLHTSSDLFTILFRRLRPPSPTLAPASSAFKVLVPFLSNMGKRTRKVGVVGKYGTRYGSSLRKQVKKMEIAQHDTYLCMFCGKKSVKRVAAGIWQCQAKTCRKVVAGGAWSVNTQAGTSVRSTVRRLRFAVEY